MKRYGLVVIAFCYFFLLTACSFCSNGLSTSCLELRENWMSQIESCSKCWTPYASSWFYTGEEPCDLFKSSPCVVNLCIPDVNDIRVEGNFRVQIIGCQDKSSVAVIGPRAEVRRIVVATNGPMLYVHPAKNAEGSTQHVIVCIAVKNLCRIVHNGTNVIEGRFIQSPGLSIIANGPGHLYLTGNIALRDINQYGMGTVTVIGAMGNAVRINVMGPGNVNVCGKQIDISQIIHRGPGRVNLTGLCSRCLMIETGGCGFTGIAGYANLKRIYATQNSHVYLYWVNSNNADVIATGDAWVGLAGRIGSINARLNERAHFQGRYLKANDLYIQTYGSSHANVSVQNKFFVASWDGSSVYYLGSPGAISQNHQGSSIILAVPNDHTAMPYVPFPQPSFEPPVECLPAPAIVEMKPCPAKVLYFR